MCTALRLSCMHRKCLDRVYLERLAANFSHAAKEWSSAPLSWGRHRFTTAFTDGPGQSTSSRDLLSLCHVAQILKVQNSEIKPRCLAWFIGYAFAKELWIICALPGDLFTYSWLGGLCSLTKGYPDGLVALIIPY